MKQILCYGDSNTWGLIPKTENRYEWGVRWTSILQERFGAFEEKINIIEEGLCGRTTVYDDAYRENRNGVKSLPLILESHSPIDIVVIMLGTNDCKSLYKADENMIASGLESCLDEILKYVEAKNILVISPIELGDEVWKEEYDPEFNEKSVKVSKRLKETYKILSERKHVHFMAASDIATPSDIDREHLSIDGHKALADAIYDKLQIILHGNI